MPKTISDLTMSVEGPDSESISVSWRTYEITIRVPQGKADANEDAEARMKRVAGQLRAVADAFAEISG